MVDVKKYECSIVESITFEYFKVADKWVTPKLYAVHKLLNKRAVYVWKLRKSRDHDAYGKRLSNIATGGQGFALLEQIRDFERGGCGNTAIIRGGIFIALTAKMLERFRSGRSLHANGSTCANPFDMLKNKKAKVYTLDRPWRVCTLGGRVFSKFK